MVQAKVLAILIDLAVEDVGIFKHWLLYCTLLGYVFLVGIWQQPPSPPHVLRDSPLVCVLLRLSGGASSHRRLYRMNAALGKYNPMFVIPLLQANYIFGAIVSGGIFFEEFAGFDAMSWSFFTLGGHQPTRPRPGPMRWLTFPTSFTGMLGIFVGLFCLRPDSREPEEVEEVMLAPANTHTCGPCDGLQHRLTTHSMHPPPPGGYCLGDPGRECESDRPGLVTAVHPTIPLPPAPPTPTAPSSPHTRRAWPAVS